MPNKIVKLIPLVLLMLLAVMALLPSGRAQKPSSFSPNVPKSWVDEELVELEVPLATAQYSPVHAPAEYYYRIPVPPIYRTYPIYAPGKEPSGYLKPVQIKVEYDQLLGMRQRAQSK